MTIATNARPVSGAQTLPLVRGAVQRSMMRVAYDIGGPINVNPGRRFAGTDGALLLEQANLLILGTSMLRPLGEELCSQIGDRHGMDMLLLRFDAYQQSYDIRFHGQGAWLTNYQHSISDEQAWFAPARTGHGPSVKADCQGLIAYPSIARGTSWGPAASAPFGRHPSARKAA